MKSENDPTRKPFADQRIVVTGGAGFLGSRVVARLQARGAKDVLVPRTATMDLRERENCRKAVAGADLVYEPAHRPPERGVRLVIAGIGLR